MEFLNFSGNKLITLAVIFGVLFIVRTIAFSIINKAAKRWERLHTRTSLVKKFVNYLTGFLLFMILPLALGFETKDVSVFLSSIFAVIGIAFFAQWSILSNITSGIIMFFTFPYKIGDFIKIHEGEDSIYGYIEDIKTFQVVIRSLDNNLVTYPNSMMLQKGVTILDAVGIEKEREKYELKKAAKQQDTEQLQ